MANATLEIRHEGQFKQLHALLNEMTLTGALDALSDWSHPDAVNAVCDGLTAALGVSVKAV